MGGFHAGVQLQEHLLIALIVDPDSLNSFEQLTRNNELLIRLLEPIPLPRRACVPNITLFNTLRQTKSDISQLPSGFQPVLLFPLVGVLTFLRRQVPVQGFEPSLHIDQHHSQPDRIFFNIKTRVPVGGNAFE